MTRYRQRHFAWDSVRDIVREGQPLGIPYLAHDLTSDEYLSSPYRVTEDMPEFMGDPAEKRLFSAQLLTELVMQSRWFTDEVRASAKRLHALYYHEQERFVRLVREWWLDNQTRIEARDYRGSSLFPDPESPSETPEGAVEPVTG